MQDFYEKHYKKTEYGYRLKGPNLQELESPSVRIQVVGHIWQPGAGLCAQTYGPKVAGPGGLCAGEIGGEFTRETIAQWLGHNAHDFSRVVDFRATVTYTAKRCECCGQPVRASEEIPWKDEESEVAFADAMYGEFEG